MKLQILVPQYKETDDIVKPLLDSIEVQQNIDKNEVGVIIVNDGSDVHLTRAFLDNYSYRIDYYTQEKKNKGVSATRNTCLDYATADYVMFCDADDMFYHAYAFFNIFQKIENGFDTLVSNFFEEKRDKNTGKSWFITHIRDCTFVHGKVHRRQYLIEQNIRWDERLTLHEDGYFNTLCQRLTRNIAYHSSPFYLWKWRANSVVRSSPNWVINTYDHFVKMFESLVNELLKRGKKQDAQDLATAGLFKFYFMTNRASWINQENKDHKVKTESKIKEFYEKFKVLYDSTTPAKREQIYNNILNSNKTEAPSLSVEIWLNRLGEK